VDGFGQYDGRPIPGLELIEFAPQSLSMSGVLRGFPSSPLTARIESSEREQRMAIVMPRVLLGMRSA
jgi:hypothetical protein